MLAPFAYQKHVLSFLIATGLTLAAVIGQAGTALLITYALGRAATQQGSPVLVSDLLVVVIFGGAVWIVIYVWLGIPATIKAYRAHTQAGPEQLVLEDDQIQIRLQQHEGAHVYLSKVSKVLPNDEHFKSGVPRVPLPA